MREPDLSLCVSLQCIEGRSPLHMTALHGRFTRAQTLLEHGERSYLPPLICLME